jgi:hypothetical protein
MPAQFRWADEFWGAILNVSLKAGATDAASQTVEKHGHSALQRILATDLPAKHPLAVMEKVYRSLMVPGFQKLPSLELLIARMEENLFDYAIVLVPIEADPVIDFVVQHSGSKVPGAGMAGLSVGERYTEKILPLLAGERLMELASCLALRKCRFSRAYSARPSSLHIKVYRGVFPVWMEHCDQHAVILAIAPVHTEVATP